LPGTVTLTTIVALADALEGGVAGRAESVHFTVPVAPTPGALQRHPPGTRLRKTGPFGSTSVTTRSRASKGPRLVTVNMKSRLRFVFLVTLEVIERFALFSTITVVDRCTAA